MSKEVPLPWVKPMEQRGFTHRGKPSASALAADAGLSTETVRRMMHGMGTPEQVNVNKVADTLGVSRIRVNRWIGIAREVEESYEPPADADLMSYEQRLAVSRIIQLYVDAQREIGQAVAGPLDEALDNLPDEKEDPPPKQGGRLLTSAARDHDKK